MIAFSYLVYQIAHRPARMEFAKAVMLAVAFLFWAANQLWPNLRQATLFNDIAIALFVLDVFLVMAGWPPTSPDESFAETYAAVSYTHLDVYKRQALAVGVYAESDYAVEKPEEQIDERQDEAEKCGDAYQLCDELALSLIHIYDRRSPNWGAESAASRKGP